ncbi:MAG: DsrE family protein [Thermoleophilia bacterium]|nr:DsrE family protein [Thermoleophilia bacterium]
MSKVTIVINERPYEGRDLAWNGLRLAEACLVDMDVNVFLMEGGVDAGRQNQKPPGDYPNLEEIILRLLEAGAQVKACGICLEACSMTSEDLIEGISEGTMMQLAGWVRESDKVISF